MPHPLMMANIRYQLLLILLGSPLLLLFVWQGWKSGAKGYPKERLGFIPEWHAHQKKPLWFHAASVGEVNAVIPLLKRFMTAHPEQPLLLTTTTISGFQNARSRIPDITHHFLPFDFHHSVQRFLKRLQPKVLFVVETEIWPNLFRECDKQGIPIEIINGRLSKKSLSSPIWVRQLYRDALTRVDQIASRSERDRDAFISLGADPEKCQTFGNIKYASPIEKERLEPFGEINRPIVITASTRDGEEQLIAASWRAANTGNHLLVIVPRHPERLIEILKALAGYSISIRSRGELPTDKTEIYLADTFGELKRFMAASELVIMGGSFVSQGGQNLIEPAAMGKATIVGPHMDNFADETRDLLAQQALIQIATTDGDELSQKISYLLKHPQERKRLGEQAEQFVKSHADTIERYMAFVEKSISTLD